jgi:hypothetical protein
MDERPSGLASWSVEQLAQGRRWVETWQRAGPELDRIRRDELRVADTYRAIARLLGPANYREPPRAPRPTSGLVEQQRLFLKMAKR